VEASSCPTYEDYRGVMIDIALEDTSLDEPALVDEVRRHIRVCPYCRHEFSGYRRVVTLFTPPPVSEEEIEEIAANVRRRVLVKVRAQDRRRTLLRYAIVLGAAASVLLGVAPLLPKFHRHESPPEALTSPRSQAVPSKVTSAPPPVVAAGPTKQQVPVKALPPKATPEPPMFAADTFRAFDMFYALREEVAHLSGQTGKGHEALEKGLQATVLGEELVRTYPDFPEILEARRNLLLCYELVANERAREEALEAYLAEAERKGGQEAWGKALAAEAERYVRTKQDLRAAQCYYKLLDRFPKGRFAGVALRQLASYGGMEQQTDMLRRALRDGIWEPWERMGVYETLIIMNITARRFKDATADLEAMLSAAKTPAERGMAESLRGVLLARQGEKMKALAHLKTVLRQYDPACTAHARTEVSILEKEVEEWGTNP